MSLWKETLELQHNQEQLLLNIGCTDSLNIAVFIPLYDKILIDYPHLDLSIQSHHSSELYGMLSEHNIDIGFVYHQLHYKNIISEKLFEEINQDATKCVESLGRKSKVTYNYVEKENIDESVLENIWKLEQVDILIILELGKL